MSGRPWHARYHSDALAGYMPLTLELRGAYTTLLDLMYDRWEALPDNERLMAGYLGVSVRKWRAVRRALLDAGKIHVTEDKKISNRRFEKERDSALKASRKRAENGSNGGRKSAELRKNNNNINGDGVAGLEVGSSLIPDTTDHIDTSSLRSDDGDAVDGPTVEDADKQGQGGQRPALSLVKPPRPKADGDDGALLLKDRIWGPCLDWLSARSGKPPDKLRPMVGKWISRHGEARVLEAMNTASVTVPLDPVSYIERTLQRGGHHAGNRGKETANEESERRRKSIAAEVAKRLAPGHGGAGGGG